MQTQDLNTVLAIERNAQLVPWSRLSFEESLTRLDICRVVLDRNTIAGFYVISHVVDEMHILNLAVATSRQGLGLGHLLVEDIINQAQQREAARLFLEVRQSNQVAQSLYQKWQFKQIAMRKDYYRTVDKLREDAQVYVRELSE